MLLHHVAQGHLEMDRSHAATWWACTGCMRCRTFCDHGNEVAATLGAGRAEAMQAGTAPAAASDVVERHEAREQRAIRAAEERFGKEALERSAPVSFVPGCTGCVTAPEAAADGLRATRGLTDEPVRVEARGCCGLPLLEAGDRDGFLRAARRFLERLEDVEVGVFQDPGCLHALREIAPQLGLGHRLRLVHSSELAAERLSRVQPLAQPPDGPVRWQDPCRLGRGLGVYEPPRTVLARLLGRAPAEFPQNRERAECTGAGGQLPRTDPQSAAAIARDRLEAHHTQGGGAVVSGCPGALRALREAGSDELEVWDLASLLARSIGS